MIRRIHWQGRNHAQAGWYGCGCMRPSLQCGSTREYVESPTVDVRHHSCFGGLPRRFFSSGRYPSANPLIPNTMPSAATVRRVASPSFNACAPSRAANRIDNSRAGAT